MRRVNFMETLLQDVRYGFRMLRKNPGFTIIAVLTLALGIGANTAIFSAVNTLLLRPLPLRDIDRLAFGMAMREGTDPFGISLLEYAAYRERSHSFASSGLSQDRSFNLTERGEPERVQGAAILADYLVTLGVKPVLGRSFTAAEGQAGGPPVALIGYGLWRRRFGGDQRLIGGSLNLEGRSTTVIGILAPGFDLPNAAEIWIPLQVNIDGLPVVERAAACCEMVARLKPDVRLEEADTELKGIARQLEQEYPQVRRGWSVHLIWLRQELIDDVTGRTQKALYALLVAVGFLLLICCTNVASLLLARGVAREREIAVRQALGAGWWRIGRQLLTESMLLATLGGLAGLLLAYMIIPLLGSLSPIQSVSLASFLNNFEIDARVLGFVVCVSVLTGVIFGSIPVLKAASSRNLIPLIKQGEQRSGGASAGRRWLNVLVVAEMAVAVTLLAGGGLVVRSFARLQQVRPGFRPEGLLTMHMELSGSKYPVHPQRVAFVERVLERVKHLPGVVSAGITTNIPSTEFISYDAVFTVEGHPPSNPADVPITAHRMVSPEYLQTLGVTLVRGRLLNEHDRADSLPVAVISEELARQGWPGEDPMGKRIKRVRGAENFPWLTVVGVVKDVKEDRFNFRINRPVWYLPYAQEERSRPLDLVVRATGDPRGLAGAVRSAVYSVDPDQPVSNIKTMTAHLAGILVTERFSAILMGMLAALGLGLAALGLYGVMAYSVSRQTAEIGLRMALGARPQDIFKLVILRGATLAVIGLSLGLGGALTLTRLLSDALYDVSPSDPTTFVVISLLLMTVAFFACYLPARRATRTDPMTALRYE